MPAPPGRELGLEALFGTAAIPSVVAELSNCWVYLLYRTVATARHDGILHNDALRASAFVAAIRSLVTRDPRLRPIIYEGGRADATPTPCRVSLLRLLVQARRGAPLHSRGRFNAAPVQHLLPQGNVTTRSFISVCGTSALLFPVNKKRHGHHGATSSSDINEQEYLSKSVEERV